MRPEQTSGIRTTAHGPHLYTIRCEGVVWLLSLHQINQPVQLRIVVELDHDLALAFFVAFQVHLSTKC